jgi:hypothetical protein
MTSEELFDIPKDAYLPAVEEFIEDCESGMFINDDGSGYWANPPKMTRIPVDCRELAKGKVLPGYTHIAWFNK